MILPEGGLWKTWKSNVANCKGADMFVTSKGIECYPVTQ